MASYQGILEDLCLRMEASESSESLRKLLEEHESSMIAIADNDGDDKDSSQVLPFRPTGLTDLLVAKMMLNSTNDQEPEAASPSPSTATSAKRVKLSMSSAQAMGVSRALVECLPKVYLPALATSVSDLVTATAAAAEDPSSSSSSPTISIGTEDAPGLLRLWVSLIARSPLGVHEVLAESLLLLLAQHDHQPHAKDALEYLVEDWKPLVTSSKQQSSEAVRCAVVVVNCISRLPQGLEVAQAAGATDLFVKMLGDFEDPLQQLSLLDALVQAFDPHSPRASPAPAAATEAWLASPPLMSLVLQCLQDPLLSDAALRYVGVLSAVKPTERALILEHVQQVVSDCGGDVPTRDTERLPLVNALSTVATSSREGLEAILSHHVLRLCWWDTERIAQPKLKAAILVSIAQVLPLVEGMAGSSKAMELYRTVGQDHCRGDSYNATTTTTQWILDKLAVSPLIEVKIASLALLAAALRVKDACMSLMGAVDRAAHAALLDLVLSPKREPTVHSQSARYDVLCAVMECLQEHPSLEENPTTLRKLQEKLALGPHGQKPLQYGADEMETA